MTTNSVFSCDEQDSLDYNGYKLYRLILENPPEHFVQRFPDDFDPSTNRMVGGYVESADGFKCDDEYHVHWVDQYSVVAGARIPEGTFVEKSLLENVTVLDGGPGRIIETMATNSTILNQTDEVVITDSYCNVQCGGATITRSTLTNIAAYNSVIEDSTLSDDDRACVSEAHLTRVEHEGPLAGTWSDISKGDLTRYRIKYAIDRGPYRPTDDSFFLFQDKNGHMATFGESTDNNNEIPFPDGDTTKERLLEQLNKPFATRPSRKVGNDRSIALVESLPSEVTEVVLSENDLADLTTTDGLAQ